MCDYDSFLHDIPGSLGYEALFLSLKTLNNNEHHHRSHITLKSFHDPWGKLHASTKY